MTNFELARSQVRNLGDKKRQTDCVQSPVSIALTHKSGQLVVKVDAFDKLGLTVCGQFESKPAPQEIIMYIFTRQRYPYTVSFFSIHNKILPYP